MSDQANPATWQPTIVAFLCNWCSYGAADLAGVSRMEYPSNIRVIRIPCTGRMDVLTVLRAIEDGADGIMVEVHHDPQHALCDGPQALTPTMFDELMLRLQEELPYGLVVEIEGLGPSEDEPGKLVVQAVIWVERAGQKAIVIGKGGESLKRIASEARQDMERLFDGKVYLEVWVKVKSGWNDDERLLKSLGYE